MALRSNKLSAVLFVLAATSCSSHTDTPSEQPPAAATESSTSTRNVNTAAPTSTENSTDNVNSSAATAPAAKADAKPYRVEEAFSVGKDVYVRSMAIDAKRNSLWIGTSLGVLEVDLTTRDVKNTYTRKEGLANEYVFAIKVDQKGGSWFGTNGGGMSSFADGKWKTYFPMHGLADYWVYSFDQQHKGPLWIGTWAGVNRFDPATGAFTTYVKELVNEWVYGVAVDEKDNVWFGTEGGVSMFDGATWRAWTHENGLGAPNDDNLPISTNTGLGTRSRHDLSVTTEGQDTYNPNYVFALMVAKDQGVWAGTWGGGVSHFDGNAWRNLTHRDGLASDIVFSLAQDQQGGFWFGTHKGVSHFDGKAWVTLNRGDGLMGDAVYAVAVAPDGDVWLGTQNGVARIKAVTP